MRDDDNNAGARFIGIREAAERVGLSRRSIRRWIVEGRLRSFRPNPKGRVLVELAELDALVLATERMPITMSDRYGGGTIFVHTHPVLTDGG